MSRESKRHIKAQRREARKRAEKTRRQLADHCAQWMYDADDAWFAKDFPRARRCFQRILHVRPTHQAANERMTELFFIDGLQAEGLQHFDRLVEPPEFPIIDFRAAAACLITERFDQGAKLAQRFLQRTEDDGLMDDPRAKARLIQAECRRLTNAKRHLARPGLLSLGAITNVEHFGCQLDTVRRVLRDFRGRVLLADEVGLGKTIEACLGLKESWMRRPSATI